jgi:hypothetical protein
MKCRVKGCTKRATANNVCEMHRARKRRYGSVDLPKRETKLAITKQGYVDMYAPGHPLARKNNRVLLHRKVAWDAGLLTDPEMVVHHINGDRSDNRLENLEVLPKDIHDDIHNSEGYRR